MSAKRKEMKPANCGQIQKRFSSTSVGTADENKLNKMRQMVLTAKKIKRHAHQMKETVSSLDQEVEVNKETEKTKFTTYIK